MEGNQNESYEEEYYGDEDVEEDIFEEGEDSEEDFDLGGSEPKPLGGIYALFDAVRNSKRSTKVSNLNKDELGDLGISVRESMRIALLGKSFGHSKFGNFFLDQAGIVSDSAMSKDGWNVAGLMVRSSEFLTRRRNHDP